VILRYLLPPQRHFHLATQIFPIPTAIFRKTAPDTSHFGDSLYILTQENVGKKTAVALMGAAESYCSRSEYCDSRWCLKRGLKRIDKPGSVMAGNRGHSDHSSSPLIAQGLERPYPRALGGPPNPPIWPCTRWGLPSARHYWRTGELLPRLFNLTCRRGGWRCIFCGTFPRSLGAVVNGHLVLWSPDFPPPLAQRRSLDPL
jgi:hypothetical protein